MLSNRLAVAALGVACVIAAGAGGYLASRQNATAPVPVAAASPSSPSPSATVPAAERPVQETEAVVGDAGSKPVSAPAVSSKRSETSPRTEPAARAAARPVKSATTTPAKTPPPLAQTWPTSAASMPSASTPSATNPTQAIEPPPAARPDDHAAAESRRAPEPPKPEKNFEELVVSADSVIGLQTENAISSELAKVEDTVQARVSRDVRVGDKVAIPAGARAIGSVVQVDRGGKFKEQARLGIRFHTLVLADGTRVPISTDTIYREGDAPTSAQKIGGGAVIGTILGAIVGGGKGAVIGGAAGAGAGTAATMAGDRSAATFPAGSPMTVRILSPVTVTVEQK